MYRTHTCGELRISHEGENITLAGFVHERRDLGGLIFLTLRDHYGFTQIIIDPKNTDAHKIGEELRAEYVVQIEGVVQKRMEGQENKSWETGEIELNATKVVILNKAVTLPFEIAKEDKKNPPSEDLRLKYRYLDLRRERIHKSLTILSKAMLFTHNYFQERGFVDIKTPILANSSPEGARDFLVPSRVHKGKFFALPQAPQQFKQMLMLGGFDKYYQVAPCFRDEDPRSDRLPGEFYQIDCEMAFVTQEDVLKFVEGYVVSIVENLTKKNVVTKAPFERIPYVDAMRRYGSDKPDVRFGYEIIDVSDIFKNTAFGIFKGALDAGGVIRCLVVPGGASFGKKYFEEDLATQAKRGKARGLAFCHFVNGEFDGSFVKFLNDTEKNELSKVQDLKDGDSLVFVADREEVVSKSLGYVRYFMGKNLKLYDENSVGFAWVLDMPFFEWNDEFDKIDFGHNPFSSPQGGLEAFNAAGNDKEKLLSIKAWQYDLACNGYEILSGGIRNSHPESIAKAFEIVGYTKEEIKEKFGYIVEAYTYGAPPHGGFAIGFDRFFMTLLDEEDIRNVFAFPKSNKYTDLMTGSPHVPTEAQLKELGIKVLE